MSINTDLTSASYEDAMMYIRKKIIEDGGSLTENNLKSELIVTSLQASLDYCLRETKTPNIQHMFNKSFNDGEWLLIVYGVLVNETDGATEVSNFNYMVRSPGA